MIRLNKVLLSILLVLVLVASVTMVASQDSGSGSIDSDDGSPTDDVTYNDDSNVGSLDSENEDVDEDPLDEEYYGSDSGSASNGDASLSVDLTKHATANPLVILLLALVGAVVLRIKD